MTRYLNPALAMYVEALVAHAQRLLSDANWSVRIYPGLSADMTVRLSVHGDQIWSYDRAASRLGLSPDEADMLAEYAVRSVLQQMGAYDTVGGPE